MVGLFTLEIQFKNKEYVALVSLRQQVNELHCQVRYINRGLMYLAAGDNLIFSIDGHLKAPDYFPDELCKTLDRCAAEAISKYLQLCRNQEAA